MCGCKPQFVALWLLINWINSGFAIYFTQSGSLNLSLSIWMENSTIHVLKASLEPDESGVVQYFISPRTQDGFCPVLSIHPTSGEVSIFSSQKDSDDGEIGKDVVCMYNVVAELQGKAGVRGVNRDELVLTLQLQQGSRASPSLEFCSKQSRETLCFGGFTSLDLFVMENSSPQQLIDLSYHTESCKNTRVSYSIKSEALTITEREPAKYSIISKSDLDRETVHLYNLTLGCNVISEDDHSVAGDAESFWIPGTLTVLDQNDSPVRREDGSQYQVVYISLSSTDNDFQRGTRLTSSDHNDFLLHDKDTVDVNNFRVSVMNDTKGLLDVDCKKYQNNIGSSISSTAVLLKLKLSSQADHKESWPGLYCVSIQVNDTTMAVSFPPMTYSVCLHWGPLSFTPTTSVVSIDELRAKVQNITRVGTISRAAIPNARVMSVFPLLMTDYSELAKGIVFSLQSVESVDHENQTVKRYTDSLEFPFGLTNHSGILYLSESSLIKDEMISGFRVSIICAIQAIEESTVELQINLEPPVNTSANCNNQIAEFCAEIADFEVCESTCGYGSAGSCFWRSSNSRNISSDKEKSHEYSTCTPDLVNCPDGVCDELEQLYPHLCPQDCTKKINGFGSLKRHENGQKYGVVSSSGVCTCHESQSFSCSCGTLPIEPPIGNAINRQPAHGGSKGRDPSHLREQPDESMSYNVLDPASPALEVLETANPPRSFDTIVIYAAILIGTVVVASFLLFLVRQKGKNKRKSPQSVVIDATEVEMGTNYRDIGGNRNLISEMEYMGPNPGANSNGFISTNAHLDPDNFFQVESKWVIPREDLLLEHVLGEGEFGRVLKGLLRSVTAAGTMHVAVKMLKVDQSDGHKSMRQEFMAEFSLLKQLDHPNVIKLLGACTSDGGPPYLVMEYAEFGSLRSFLRKCRRIESINQKNGEFDWNLGDRRISGNAHLSPEFVYTVTAQEVLGFSWQIAKGMAYLSDMKMVHRDLAARNILLTKTKVCKISDFGLTRDIYVDDAYRKKSKDRVPVKWLAPECLTDELYTSKSDVWAFGILLWELTTLGASPYPGIQTELLYSLLDSGYRMQQPLNCSNEVYTIMRKCWSKHALDRPTFHELVYELSRLLENGIEYLKLDIPTVSNPGYDIFSQAENIHPTDSHLSAAPQGERSENSIRRNSSMENLRLIDYEISTTDDSGNQSISHLRKKHTYINNPQGSQDCDASETVNSSGYESPITLSNG